LRILEKVTPQKPNSIKIPSKLFLLGEYSVLQGDPAIVLAIPPEFTLQLLGHDEQIEESANESWLPHPESPAGRIYSALPLERQAQKKRWLDAHSGMGGFGGSTAEFAALSYLLGDRAVDEVLQRYHALHQSLPNPPSGADLAGQWLGGAILYQKNEKIRTLTSSLQDLPAILFSASHIPERKVATHRHLETLELPSLKSLTASIENALFAIERNDLPTLGLSLVHFAESLQALGLESTSAQEDRLAFLEVKGVLGAKGCGALQSDALIVLYENEEAKLEAIHVGESRGLTVVSDRLQLTGGVRTCE
jgi:mevalonate kinase